ncbi:DUF6023 family protein [Paractinoplanes atraurantiacus]|uniref:Uncharacterized protein n=1 Tax=Paractinoplanes atraurantiacus TaxID=1036182 RepID=A0A285F1G0_9ACTN|nr:DUF6023 family protein [Actinoplanes atraurantiacus]SNY04524.1 hypothetical protein SAMN05421748_101250 [Actinoplanes atraurantiacus]
MTTDRQRGVVLYSMAAVLLAGGAAWWLVTAPDDTKPTSQAQQWRQAAERLLPDVGTQEDGATLTLNPGAEQAISTEVSFGQYSVAMVCVGGAGSTVRVSLDNPETPDFSGIGGDSGLGMSCEQERSPETFPVQLSDALRMTVSAGQDSEVVFRYSLVRIG